MRRNLQLRRGQVWFIKENEYYVDTALNDEFNSVYTKSRPYLIMSRKETLDTSTIVNCIPLSRSADPDFPAHIVFKSQRDNLMQIVCCEQATTRNREAFLKNGYYMFDAPYAVVEEAAEKVYEQFSGEEHNKVALMEDRLDRLSKLVEDLTKSVVKINKREIPSIEDIRKILGDTKTSTEIIASLDEEASEVVSLPREGKILGKKGFWTENKKFEFLDFCEVESLEKAAEKFNLSKTTAYEYQRRWTKELLS